MIYYAGIGSRETPDIVLDNFVLLGALLWSKYGCVLRSGGANGADSAFERGVDLYKGKKEIYLPWDSFNQSDSKLIVESEQAYQLAEKFHPNWDRLGTGAKKLMARNSHQVLGVDLNTPSSAIICWTRGGLGQGGTGQAIRMAKHYGIPVLDAGSYSNLKDFNCDVERLFSDLLKETS